MCFLSWRQGRVNAIWNPNIVTAARASSQKGLKMLEDQKLGVFSCCCLTKLISVCRPCPVSKLRRPDWEQRVDEEELPAGQNRYRWGHDRPWAQRTHCRPGSCRWWVDLFDRKFDPSFFFCHHILLRIYSCRESTYTHLFLMLPILICAQMCCVRW